MTDHTTKGNGWMTSIMVKEWKNGLMAMSTLDTLDTD